ncbi:DUF7470 family protein [Halobaculum sp. P14]|uniref:DUF7470 family protein n=1 Tax=Halobaculum sp. P14 TaxID=3421638 RepID=UPI003EBA253F
MFQRLGVAGVVGALTLVAGLAVVAYSQPVVAVGLAMILVGTGLVVKGLATNLMRQFGFA